MTRELMEVKRFTATLDSKDGLPGSVRSQFVTYDEIDKDGDVIRAGALTEGQEVFLVPWHDWSGKGPVGHGTIHNELNAGVFDGGFWLNTQDGEQTYNKVKNAPHLWEWSWGFFPEKWSYGDFQGANVRFLEKVRIFEVSPVMVGAGNSTRTLGIKGADGKLWTPKPDQVKTLRDLGLLDETTMQAIEDGDPDALFSVISSLLTLPDEGAEKSYADHLDAVLAAVQGLQARTKSLAELRAKDGRAISEARRQRLGAHSDALRSVAADLDQLLEETAPPSRDDDGKAAVLATFLAFKRRELESTRARLGLN